MLGHSWVPVTLLIARLIQFSVIHSEFWGHCILGEFFTAFAELGLLLPIMMYKSLFTYLAVLLINFNCDIHGKISTLVTQISLFILLPILLEDWFGENHRISWSCLLFLAFGFVSAFWGISNTRPVLVRDIVQLYLQPLKLAICLPIPLTVCQNPVPLHFPCVAVLWLSRVTESWVVASGPSNSEGGRAKLCSPDCSFLTSPDRVHILSRE